MLTVHKMPLKNQFLTGISSGHDKIFYQNEAQPITRLGFTGDCLGVDYDNESSNKPDTAFTGTEILNYTSTKPGDGVVLCARGFDSIRSNFEIETAKSNKFLQVFTSWQQGLDDSANFEPTA